MTETVVVGAPGWQEAHVKLYLESGGARGHLLDFTPGGGLPDTPCLLLKTTGRKSGEPRLSPLIYGRDGDRYVVVASKGGAPAHPAWFLNLQAHPEVRFQIATKKYEGEASVAGAADHRRLYEMMARIYPPYVDYQRQTDREIPVVWLQPKREIERI